MRANPCSCVANSCRFDDLVGSVSPVASSSQIPTAGGVHLAEVSGVTLLSCAAVACPSGRRLIGWMDWEVLNRADRVVHEHQV